jgi:hypothetical protein
LHPRTDLALLHESLSQLSSTPYFNRSLEKQVGKLIQLIEHVLAASPPYDEAIVRSLVAKIWTTHRYLQGSTTKESPYEIEYCLRPVISEWLPGEFLLTTALTDEKDFHLNYGDPWDYVNATITGFSSYPDSRLIFVGVPRLYKYLPLFCSALFHELGHFIDLRYGVTDAAMLAYPFEGKPDVRDILEEHRREYFADLFAACYVGRSIADSLQTISPDGEMTATHPSTAKRLDLIEDFITGQENGDLDMWRDVLSRLKLPQLKPRFLSPDLSDAFDDIRPVSIVSDAELFGLFPSGWSYMARAIHGDGPEWSRGASQLEIVRIVNDLTEKSIRNASIRKLWETVVA